MIAERDNINELLQKNKTEEKRKSQHCTTDQLFYFCQSIIDSFQEKPPKKTTAIFFDMTSAFDRVWREKLREKLQNIGSLSTGRSDKRNLLVPFLLDVQTLLSGISICLFHLWPSCVAFHHDCTVELTSSSRLNNLLDFLRREVEGEERRLLARRGFEGSSPKEKLRNKFKQSSNIPTAAGLFSAKEMGCLFCENNHQSKDCITAQSMPFNDKRAKIYEKRCCLKCLKPGHLAKACKRTVQCNICAKGHYVLLCPDLPCNRKEKTHVSEVVQSALAKQQCTRDVTLMTLMVNIMGNNGYRRVRALLDPGSQKSYILESTALEVKLKPVGNVNIAHSLFGGTQTETKCHKVYTVALCSNLSELDTLREFEFLGQDIICGEIPRTPKGAWLNELKGSRIWLSDLGRDSPKIELLIGSDIYGSLLSGRVKQLENGLTAIETHLGWTICGPSPKKDEQTDYSSLVVISMHSRNMSVDYLWDLETIGIKDPRENLTKLEEDKIVHQHFLNTVHQLEDGRFCVGLPWLGNQEGIPSNRHIAERRLFNTTRKLRAKGIFSEYDRVFQEWLAEGVIEKVSPEDLNRDCHYLPHHPVVKANSNTTKIRPVFDASCKDKGNLSLNDCLASGPNVIEQIPAILLKFREKAIGVIADIRKAFLQIEVKEEDRDYLRFLWWKNNHQIQVFRHKRVVFGVTCSPYLLGAVILHHLKGVSSEFGALPQKLMGCLYIDNCVTSVDTEAELVDLVEKSTEIFAKAKMDLRMWQFGPIHRVKEVYSRLPPSVDIERSEEASVLGMKWNLLEDTLNVTPKFGVIINSLSKRDLLSHTQQIFDPIGFLAPVLLPAKLLIQQAWTVKTDWDEPLPTTIQENFMKWYMFNGVNLDSFIREVELKARVGKWDPEVKTLLMFEALSPEVRLSLEEMGIRNDSSFKSIASKLNILYPKKARGIRECLKLIEGLKQRVGESPMVFKERFLAIRDKVEYSFDDSLVFEIFLENVLDKYREAIVRSEAKSIDKAVSIMATEDSVEHRCSFMKGVCSVEGVEEINSIKSEMKMLSASVNRMRHENEQCIADLRGEVEKLTKLLGEIRLSPPECSLGHIASDCSRQSSMFFNRNTLNNAEIVNTRSYGGNQFRNLPIVKVNINGNMWHLLYDTGSQVSIIDSEKCKVLKENWDDALKTLRIVSVTGQEQTLTRVKTCRVGNENGIELGEIRFWLMSLGDKAYDGILGINDIRRFNIPLPAIRERCNMISLKPEDRDYVDLSYVASVHRPMVSSSFEEKSVKRIENEAVKLPPTEFNRSCECSAGSFDRGDLVTLAVPKTEGYSNVYGPFRVEARVSDVNFRSVVAVNLLEHSVGFSGTFLPVEGEQQNFPQMGTFWLGNRHFPRAPEIFHDLNFSKTARMLMPPEPFLLIPRSPMRCLKSQILTFEELSTLTTRIEACLISRPICPLSSDSDDFNPLTPGHFLIGRPLTAPPEYNDDDDVPINYLDRWNREYLNNLQQRLKWLNSSPNIKEGDLILLKDTLSSPAMYWSLGRITKVFPGADGKVRVAEVKTKHQERLTRTVSKIVPLPFAED
ncbi:hypothetical protein LAZ67_5002740 [Cordylochernes scorpioides]|uniref:CCHC-type domain-containing protein n=1 Tax=Cordylochernes scorpioides TaxID=51811 RepID=A0ABY6KGN8_9ARAC|nr:hypothetical protein LAZ67_5002740 [Cordylochernes scorpioides]